MELKKRYNELCDLLLEYNRCYYELDQPAVDDAVYDRLMAELTDLEKQHPELIRSDSPASNVGGKASSSFAKVIHVPPMLSLSNVFSAEELDAFDLRCREAAGRTDIKYAIELKYDGLAVELVYKKGKFVQGSTRGNGAVGEDVTANIAAVKNVPLRLKGSGIPDELKVRGEVIMPRAEFDRLNREREQKGEPLFANPRNAAAGSLRQQDASVTGERELKLCLYGMGSSSVAGMIKSEEEMFVKFGQWGLPQPEYFETGTWEDAKKFYDHWCEHRYELGFDIDGVVVKMDSFEEREAAGYIAKAPKWAAAWKFPAQEAVTLLESVDCQVGRTGVVTPVANLSPINIGGVIVRRATLHNFSEVKNLNVHVGDLVKVIRSGDVIPKITASAGPAGTGVTSDIVPPERCPVCGELLRREDVYLRCINRSCPAVKSERLKFFVSKEGLDIEFFGPELVTRLMDAGILASPGDIFRLTDEKLMSVERMGEKSAAKILSSIENRKSMSLSVFIRALGIRNVGGHAASLIAERAVSLDRLRAMTEDDLMAVREIGPETAASVYSFFHDQDTIAAVEDLLSAGAAVEDEQVSAAEDSPFSGKTLVVTGTLDSMGRDEAEDLIRSLGGRAVSSVSRKTDFVVAGTKAGSKLVKAQELGVQVLSEKEFLDMAGKK